MNTETLPPQFISYFILVTRYNIPAEQLDDADAVRSKIEAIPRSTVDLDIPMEEIELAAIFEGEDGGSEAIKNVDKRRVLAWLDRIESRQV